MEDTDEQSKTGGARAAALKAAAAAATAGAATVAVRKAMSHDASHGQRGGGERDEGDTNGSSELGSRLASAGATVWSAASDALLPMAEDAAEAAGRYLAEHGPEVVRERILPRFIEAFKDAA